MYAALCFAVRGHGNPPLPGSVVSAGVQQPSPLPPIDGTDAAFAGTPPTYRRATYGQDADN